MPSYSILIVEDENITAMELQERLSGWNYHVVGIASSGAQAIRKAADLRPDLILMDIILKGALDGIETAEQIHATRDIPVIYVTAYADKKTLQRAKISSPYGYILKPFDERELQIVLEMALYKHQTEQKLRQYQEHLEELVHERTLAFRQAKEEAEAASYAKTAFMTNVSHEFFTPLNGILGYAQLLQNDAQLGGMQRTYVNIIRQSGERLLKTINNILDVARMESQPIELDESCFPLVDFLEELSQRGQEWTEAKGLEFHTQIASELPDSLYSDRERLQQVLLSLLDNAAAFSDEGRVTFRVSRADSAPQCAGGSSPSSSTVSRLRFEVEDTGPGIPEEMQESVFTAFKQVDEYLQKRDGKAGLGLAIARRLVRRMGGELALESTPGTGSLFSFELDFPDCAPDPRMDSPNTPSPQMPYGQYTPLPEKSLLPLYRLAVQGDVYEIMRYLEALEQPERQCIPFVRKVQQFIGAYNITRLRRFLESYLPKDAIEMMKERK